MLLFCTGLWKSCSSPDGQTYSCSYAWLGRRPFVLSSFLVHVYICHSGAPLIVYMAGSPLTASVDYLGGSANMGSVLI